MAKILSLFKTNHASGNSRVVDLPGLVSFSNSIEEFISNSQSLLGQMDSLLQTAEGTWRDDTGIAFIKSFRDVAADILPINEELRKRKENIDMQIAKLREYNDI